MLLLPPPGAAAASLVRWGGLLVMLRRPAARCEVSTRLMLLVAGDTGEGVAGWRAWPGDLAAAGWPAAVLLEEALLAADCFLAAPVLLQAGGECCRAGQGQAGGGGGRATHASARVCSPVPSRALCVCDTFISCCCWRHRANTWPHAWPLVAAPSSRSRAAPTQGQPITRPLTSASYCRLRATPRVPPLPRCWRRLQRLCCGDLLLAAWCSW